MSRNHLDSVPGFDFGEPMSPSELIIPTGLSDSEAAVRLRQDGPNELPRGEQRSLLRIILDVFREPMFQLLIAAGFIYLVIGDLGEALMLLGFAGLSFAGYRRLVKRAAAV